MNSVSRIFRNQKKLLKLNLKHLSVFSSWERGGLFDHNFRKQLLLSYGSNKFNIKTLLGLQLFITKIDVKEFRGLRRYPIKVTHPTTRKTYDDYIEDSKVQTAEPINEDVVTEITERSKKRKHGSKSQQLELEERKGSHSTQPNQTAEKMEEKLKESLKNIQFKLFSNAPHSVRSLIGHTKSLKQRQKRDIFLLEGWRLISEAFTSGLKPIAIFYSRSSIFLKMIPSVAKSEKELTGFLNLFPLYKTPYATFKLWSSLTTPPGIMAVFSMSSALHMCEKAKGSSFPLTVILDDIRDPNNMGSILRTVAAAGVHKTILMEGCCDPFDVKVLRAACGAHFHMHCVSKVAWKNIEAHVDLKDASLYLANACQGTSFMEEDDVEENPCFQTFRVPDSKRTCSRPTYEELKVLAEADSERNTFYEMDEKSGENVPRNESFDDPERLELFKDVPLPEVFFNKIKFYHKGTREEASATLILGGETGLSNSAKKFALEKDGIQVGIPLLNGVESLNSAVATGILVYEMQRQYWSLSRGNLKQTEVSS